MLGFRVLGFRGLGLGVGVGFGGYGGIFVVQDFTGLKLKVGLCGLRWRFLNNSPVLSQHHQKLFQLQAKHLSKKTVAGVKNRERIRCQKSRTNQ